MPILSVLNDSIGETGQTPKFVYINTNDPIQKVTEKGYLNGIVSQGTKLSEYNLAVVTTQISGVQSPNQCNIFDIVYADGDWSLVVNGGGSTPFIRNTNILSGTGNSFVVPIPEGSQVGDYIFIFAAHAFAIATPGGFTSMGLLTGSNWNGNTFFKILVPSDISTGSFTIGTAGVADGIFACATIIGTSLCRLSNEPFFVRSSTGLNTYPLLLIPGSPSNLILLFSSNRGDSSNTFSKGTVLETISTTNASGSLYSLSPVFGLDIINYFSSPGTGFYIGMIPLAGF